MLIMVLTLGVMATGCGTKTEEAQESEVEVSEEEGTSAGTPVEIVAPSFDDMDLSTIVTLPTYKGMELEKEITIVTQEAIDADIESALENAPEEDEDGVVDEGDTANIDYEGKVDDVAFEGGTDQDYDLKIGSGAFIPGFEEQLIGMKKGETKDINVTFPEQYNEELAGKDAVFTVKVNDVKKVLDAPTDEWVAANTEYKTVEEYRASIEKELKEYNEQSAEAELATQAMTKLFDESEVSEYPEEVIEYGKQLYEENVQQYADYQGQTIEEFVESQGMTMDQYNQDKEDNAQGIAKQVLVLNAIAQAEGIKIGGEAYKAELAIITEEMQMSEEELNEQYGADNVEQNVLVRCVQNLVLDSANVKEVEVSDVGMDDEEMFIDGEELLMNEDGEIILPEEDMILEED